MLADVTTALSSIKLASDFVGLVLKTKVDAAVTQKAIELQSAIISLQSAIMSIQAENQRLLEENNGLKAELAKMHDWEAEAQKYMLTQVAPGLAVYSVKKEQRGTEPNHYLCPNCYDNKRKSVLQRGMDLHDGYEWACVYCKSYVFFYPEKESN
jgi:hypothetical protein